MNNLLEVSEETKRRIEDVVLNFLGKAQEVYGFNRVPAIPDIEYGFFGRVIGMATYERLGGIEKYRLKFNLAFLKNNMEVILGEVIPHEVAHCVVYQLTNGSNDINPHGIEWRGVMARFGVRSASTTKADSSLYYLLKNGGKEYHYKCSCMTHKVTKIRHNKIQRGDRRICRYCKKDLVFDKIVEHTDNEQLTHS